MCLRWAFAAIVLLIFMTPALAQNYNQMVVFGDSNVDSSYYRQLSNPNNNNNAAQIAAWEAAIATGAGAPTSRPGQMNSEVLAGFFGLTANPANLPGGTNYATSGAKNVTVNSNQTGGFRGAVPTTVQISNYLFASGGAANPNALYLINSGANDVSFAVGDAGQGPYPSNPDQYLRGAAGALAQSIADLKAAGARYVIVPGRPFSFPTGAANADERAARLLYTQALWSELDARGVNFIPADFNAVRVAIAADRAAFGFEFIDTGLGHTACTRPNAALYPFAQNGWALWCSPTSPVSQLIPGADQTRLFADEQHLSTAGQKIEADYFYSLLTAPSQISLLAETAVKARTRLTADIATQIALSQSRRGANGLNAWVTGDISSLSIDNYQGFADESNTSRSITAGFDYGVAPGLIVGAAFSTGALESSFGEFGDFEQDERSISLYAAYAEGGFWGNVIGTYGRLDYDLDRIAPIGITLQSNLGSTDGENWSVAFQGGYDFTDWGVTHGPVIGFVSQHVTVDGFTESGSFTSLQFGEQTRTSNVAQLGYRVGFDWSNLHPFAQVVWNHEFADTGRDVVASLTTISAPSFALPAVALGTDWGSATVGVAIDLGEGVKVVAKGTADFGESSAILYGAQLGLNVAF
jgi:outer membrane lipase/esterase